jgi:hypothetical protein
MACLQNGQVLMHSVHVTLLQGVDVGGEELGSLYAHGHLTSSQGTIESDNLS